MRLSGYLIEKYTHMGNAYTCRRLVEEAADQGIDLKIVGVHDVQDTQDGICTENADLKARDFSINRYKWGKIKDRINALTARSYNEISAFNRFINKYEQVRFLHSDAFIMPKYVLGTALQNYQIISQKLGTPFVAKGLESSMGEEIILIENMDDYLHLKEKFDIRKEWLFEEFIGQSAGRDIRFFSVRGDVIACMQRKSQGDFRANVALGASVEPYEITPQIRKIAADIFSLTHLDFLGIDLLFGEEKPYFCEINVMPGLEGIERASEVNVAREIITTIKGDFSDGPERGGRFRL